MRRIPRPRLLPLLAACLLAGAGSARAEGSVDLAQILPLFEASPALAQVLRQFRIEPTGTATRLGRRFDNLGGARVGPYEFAAHPLDSPQWTLTMLVETRRHWLAADGSELPESEREHAVAVRESLLRVSFATPSPGSLAGADPVEAEPVDDFQPVAVPDGLRRSVDALLRQPLLPPQWRDLVSAEEDPLLVRLRAALVHPAPRGSRPYGLPDPLALPSTTPTSPVPTLGRVVELEAELSVARSLILTLWLDRHDQPVLLRQQDISWELAADDPTPESVLTQRVYFEQGRVHHLLQLDTAPPAPGCPDPDDRAAAVTIPPLIDQPLAARRQAIEAVARRLADFGLGRRPLVLATRADADPLATAVLDLGELLTGERTPLAPVLEAEPVGAGDDHLLDPLPADLVPPGDFDFPPAFGFPGFVPDP